jgi:hypothetical protein
MISVGGCVDTSVDVDTAGNTDGERLSRQRTDCADEVFFTFLE